MGHGLGFAKGEWRVAMQGKAMVSPGRVLGSNRRVSPYRVLGSIRTASPSQTISPGRTLGHSRPARRRFGGAWAIAFLFWLLLPLCLPTPSQAVNGLNQIGFGTESLAMGGADVPVARDAYALNINPAGIAQIEGTRIDASGGIGYLFGNRHKDRLGNDHRIEDPLFPLGNAGMVRSFEETDLRVGLGLFAQGGTGAQYKHFATPFGTSDRLSSEIAIARLSAGLAYPLSPRLSIGVAANLQLARLEQRVFPNTSFLDPANPASSFFGQAIEGASGQGVTFKFGLHVRPRNWLALGLTYTTKGAIDLKQGNVVFDQSALGIGKVQYDDLEIKGLATPQEISFGLALRPHGDLLLAVDISWLDWSNAIDTIRLDARKPHVAGAPPRIAVETPQDWRDQYVFALGLAYEPEGLPWVFRLGYNYAKHPIPDRSLNPLLPQIPEQSVTGGIGFRASDRLAFDFTVQYIAKVKETYNNPCFGLGPGAVEIGEALGLFLGASYRF